MIKKYWALLFATALYSYLFHLQHAGLNFMLFSVFLAAMLGWSNPHATGARRWQAAAVLTLFSACFVFIHGSWLALLANGLSLLVLAGATMNRHASVMINLLSAGGSIAGSPAFLAEDIYNRSMQPQHQEKRHLKGLLVWLVPAVLAAVFFLIYRAANPLFARFTSAINLDFVTFRWFMFTLGGLLVCYGLVCTRRFPKIDNWEAGKREIKRSDTTAAWNERKAAVILFVALNGMLLFMNALDVNYLYLGAGLPEGITHKQFVHHGVGNLILSIVLGISVILYFFRGALNFSNNRLLKWLVYAWIAQNLFMVASTSLRNEMYVSEALVTYKRIGVFYWTGLAAAGLLTAAYKVHARRHAWFLVRSNSMFALAILVASAAIDWDKFITDYNLTRIGHIKDLDKRYLISLSETNFRKLYEIAGEEGFENNVYYHYEFSKPYGNREQLNRKLAAFLDHIHGTDWRSFSLRRERVLAEIAWLDSQEKIRTLDLTGIKSPDLEAFVSLRNIRTILLPANFVVDSSALAHLRCFNKLDHLEIPTLSYKDLLQFVKLRNLKTVRIGTLDRTALAFLRRQMPGTSIEVAQQTYNKEPTAFKHADGGGNHNGNGRR